MLIEVDHVTVYDVDQCLLLRAAAVLQQRPHHIVSELMEHHDPEQLRSVPLDGGNHRVQLFPVGDANTALDDVRSRFLHAESLEMAQCEHIGDEAVSEQLDPPQIRVPFTPFDDALDDVVPVLRRGQFQVLSPGAQLHDIQLIAKALDDRLDHPASIDVLAQTHCDLAPKTQSQPISGCGDMVRAQMAAQKVIDKKYLNPAPKRTR